MTTTMMIMMMMMVMIKMMVLEKVSVHETTTNTEALTCEMLRALTSLLSSALSWLTSDDTSLYRNILAESVKLPTLLSLTRK